MANYRYNGCVTAVVLAASDVASQETNLYLLPNVQISLDDTPYVQRLLAMKLLQPAIGV